MTIPTAEGVLEEQGRDRGRIEYLLEQEPLFRQVEQDNCDHDWELLGDKKKICTYPECGKIVDA